MNHENMSRNSHCPCLTDLVKKKAHSTPKHSELPWVKHCNLIIYIIGDKFNNTGSSPPSSSPSSSVTKNHPLCCLVCRRKSYPWTYIKKQTNKLQLNSRSCVKGVITLSWWDSILETFSWTTLILYSLCKSRHTILTDLYFLINFTGVTEQFIVITKLFKSLK